MNTDFVTAYNPDDGRAGKTPRSVFEHPVFGKHLVEARDGEKSRVPALHKSQTVEEYKDTHPNSNQGKDKSKVEVHDPIVELDESPKEK